MKTALITLLLCAGIGWSQTIDANPRGLVARTFAALGTPANGTIVYCSDCTATNPVAGSGTGTTARRENGAWNGGGGTGGLTSFTSPGVSVNIGGTLTAPTVDVNTALIQSLAQGSTLSPNSCFGSVAAGTLTCTMLPSPGAFVDSNNYPLEVVASSSNAIPASTTLTIAGLGAKAIFRPDGVTAIQTGDLAANFPFRMTYVPSANGAGGAYILWSLPLSIAGAPAGDATLTQTIAHGTTAASGAGSLNNLGAITPGAGNCLTLTVTATGVVATDVLTASANGALGAVVGFIPATTGGVTLQPYAGAGNVNFQACNWSTGSQTIGTGAQLNWRVSR